MKIILEEQKKNFQNLIFLYVFFWDLLKFFISYLSTQLDNLVNENIFQRKFNFAKVEKCQKSTLTLESQVNNLSNEVVI